VDTDRGGAVGPDHRAECPDTAPRVQRRDQPAGHRLGHRLDRGLGQQEDRRLDAGLPEGHPLLHQGHGQPGRAAGQGGPGHRQGPVPVAVGLHHRAQGGRAGHRAEDRSVVLHGIEVDVGPHRPPPVSHVDPPARPAKVGALTAPGPPGRGDHRPPGPRRVPGPPARRGRGGARPPASSGATPRAIVAPMRPVRTSPVPAVASAVVPAIPRSTRPDGSATAVVGPLTSATTPAAPASRRAAAIRSSPGRSPISRPYSPSCGVRTTVDRAAGAEAPSTLPRAKSPSASTTTGTGDSATSPRTSPAAAPLPPRPGPITTAAHREATSRASADHSSVGSDTPTASPAGRSERLPPGTPSRTIPAPQR